MMELETGQIVVSRQGRDVTNAYMVVGFEGERLLLADGEKWPLAHPKKKNPRHITPTRTVLAGRDRDTDLKLKAALGAYAAGHAVSRGG